MDSKESITIYLNDTALEATPGQMLIEVADANGIEIPRFCYHKKLSTSANCRMCLVEVEKAPKMMPACATPVADGMKAWSRSPRAIAAQKSVMEFLLINHPLDCPVCDQGGECDLQEIAVGYGTDQARYQERKRLVQDKEYGPLVSTEMTRCIHCTRCVRFGTEIAGVTEIGGTGRGDHLEIGTYVERALSSELSGNIIDLCPVGALLSKPFLYTARSWELKNYPGIAPHDAVGSHIWIQSRNGEVMRVLPRENEAINEIWLSDRDRFSYLGLGSGDRVTTPLKRDHKGQLQPCEWSEALEAVVKGLRQAGTEAGALSSPSATVEEQFLLATLMRGFGSDSIDHRIHQRDFSADGLLPRLNLSLPEVERLDAALLVGSHLRHEQPLLAHRLRKAALAGGRVASIHHGSIHSNYPLIADLESEDLVAELAAVARAMVSMGKGSELAGLTALVADTAVSESHRLVARTLIEAERGIVLVGAMAHADPRRDIIERLATAVAQMSGVILGVLHPGSNGMGAALVGATPAAGGRDAATLASSASAALLLLGVEGEDLIDPAAVAESGLIVAVTTFADEWIQQHADWVLPLASFTETSGTYVNLEGNWQSFGGAVAPRGDARPGWKILRVLSTLAGLEGVDFTSSEEVLEAARKVAADVAITEPRWVAPANLGDCCAGVGQSAAIYRIDPLVRRSEPLQRSPLGQPQEGGH